MSETIGTTTPAKGGAYRKYVLTLLMVVYVFNFIDRQILVILQESIKADMGLSDSQLALLSGFSFAIFYVTAGIPIARWAGAEPRKTRLLSAGRDQALGTPRLQCGGRVARENARVGSEGFSG